MGWGSVFKGILNAERRAAAVAALAGVKVHGVDVGQLQQEGEAIGSQIADVVKDSKTVAGQFKKPKATGKPPAA